MNPTRLDKVKALYLAATTAGEHDAAASAITRVLVSMLEQDRISRHRIARLVHVYRPQIARTSKLDSLDIAIRCFNARHQDCQIPTDVVTVQSIRSVYSEVGRITQGD